MVVKFVWDNGDTDERNVVEPLEPTLARVMPGRSLHEHRTVYFKLYEEADGPETQYVYRYMTG